MEAERKKFYKNLISYCIFFNNKKCFPLLTCKVFLPNPDACDLQPAVSYFAAHGLHLLVQYWHTQQAVWRFMVILSLPQPNNTVQTFQELRIHLSTDSYLWSLHLVVNIVKAMFKLICLNLIFTPCCKYTYSKNNVKFLKSTSSELRQELF